MREINAFKMMFITLQNVDVSKPKHQHTDQTIKEKIKILGKLDCGVKAIDLCKQFNLSQSICLHGKNRDANSMRW